MDDFNSLKQTVNSGRVSDTLFTLQVSALDSQSINALSAKYLQDGQIALSNYQVTESEADQSIKVIGTGSKAPFTGINVETTFKLNGTEPTLSMRATAASGWSLASGFPILKDSIVGDLSFTNASLNLASYDLSNDIKQNLLFFEGTPAFTSALGGLGALVSEKEPQVSGSIDVLKGAPSMTLGATVGSLDLGLSQPLTLTFEACSVPVIAETQDNIQPGETTDGDSALPPDATVFLRFRTAIPFSAQGQGYTIPLAAVIYDPTTNIAFDIDLENFDRIISAGLDELAPLTGQTTLLDKLPKLDNFRIAELITLRRLRLHVNPSASSKLTAVGLDIENTQPWPIIQDQSLGKSITLEKFRLYVTLPMDTKRPKFVITGIIGLGASGQFFLSAYAPDYAVAGGLVPGATINLKEAIEYFAGSDTSDIPELEITGFDFYAQPSASYSLNIEVKDDWPISLGFKDLKIADVKFSVDYTSGATTAAAISGLFNVGGVDLSVSAQHPGPASEWVFTETAATTTPIDLAAVIKELLPSGIELPDELSGLKVRNLSTSWNTRTHHFTFSGETDLSLTLVGETFNATLTLNLDSTLDQTSQQRTNTGTLTGDLRVGETDFKITYDFMATEKILKGTWTPDPNGMGFERLARSFKMGLPELGDVVPDLSLKSASFVIDYSQTSGETFMIAGDSTSFGEAFFVLQKDLLGQWSFAFGVALPREWRKLSQLPDPLGENLRAADFLEFDSAFFILSNSQFKNFQLPGFPGLSAYPMQISPGLVCGAVIDFTKAAAGTSDNSAAVKNLHGITGKDVLLLSVTLSSNPANIALTVDLEGSVAIKGSGNDQITLTNTAVVIRVEPLAITLRGSVEFPVQDQKVLATGYLTISPIEAVAAFDVRAEDKYIPIPMGFKGVHLTEIGVEMGVVFEPPSVMLGLEGNFVIGETATPGVKPPPTRRALDAMPNSDEFVFVFNATVDAVNPLLLSMYLDEVSLQTLITALLDHPLEGLPNVLTDIQASQLMLYWCDAPPGTSIQQPDGTMAAAGTAFNANLDLWGFHAHASVNIDPIKGFTGDAYMNPVHIAGVIDVTGNGTGTPDTYKGTVKVEPGGAVVHISTLSSPFLNINWNITLFNLASEAVNAQLTKEGFTFSIEYKVGTVFDSALSCSLKREGEAAVFRMKFSIKLDLKIGPIEILGANLGVLDLTGVDFAAAVFASVGKDGLLLTIDGSFSYDNAPRFMPQIKLSVAPSDLEELPQLIAKQIADEAETIFKDLYDEARRGIQDGFDELAKVGDEARYDVTQGVEDVDQLITDIRSKTDQDVANIASQADQYSQQTLYEANQLVQETYAEMQRVEQSYEETNAEVARLATEAEQEAERALQQGEQGAQQLAADAATQARQAANDAGQIVNTVGQAVQEGANDVWNAVKKY